MTLERFGYQAAIVLVVACFVVVLLLVLVRYAKDRSEDRRRARRGPIWRQVMMLTTGDAEEADEAMAQLLWAPPADRAVVEGDAFALVPKLRGSSRDRLRAVLRAWGSADRSLRLSKSRSAVRRCRGLYRLGVLGEGERRYAVLAGLDDRDFGVRRTAMLALGSFPDPIVVESLLRGVALEPRLRREFLTSIDRIGAAAVPVLRKGLTESLAETGGGGMRGHLAAEALGLVGAFQAVPELEAALVDSTEELTIACINALGDLGAPSSVTALCRSLDDARPSVRLTAATALGQLGGPAAVAALNPLLVDGNVEVARAAANALSRCGATGRVALHRSVEPVAREVLALVALRSR